MYRCALVQVLFLLHCVVILQQRLSDVLSRCKPTMRRKNVVSSGIRPAAPKCLAIAIVDAEVGPRDLQQLEMVIDWCVPNLCTSQASS